MGYYTRVLTTTEACVPVGQLQGTLEEERNRAVIKVASGSESDWEQLILMHRNGPDIAIIERSPVFDGSLGSEELDEFGDTLQEGLPSSAAEWLRAYFPKVKCIYAFQHLKGTDEENGFAALNALRNEIWSVAPAILQADHEGFSNEAGYHILWQFSDNVNGDWWMGVLRDGEWVHFQMDLGNREHREAFLRGEVPDGMRRA